MKARSRQAPVRPALSQNSPPTAPQAEVVSPAVAAPWEHWLDRLPAARRQELLPWTPPSPPLPLANDSVSSPLPQLLKPLLAGRANGLPVVPPRALPTGDEVPAAVRRALETPDICLWQRAPAQDVAGPTAEVVRQAVRQGLRVLLLASAPAPLERVLSKLSADPTFLAVRFSAPGERSSNGPLTRFGLDEQRGALRGRLLTRAAQAHAEFEVRRARAQAEAVVWDALATVVRDIAALDARQVEWSARLEYLTDEVGREAKILQGDQAAATGPFASDFALVAKGHRERLEACDRTLIPLRDQRDALDASLAEVAREQDRLRPQLAAYRAGHWWKIAYWQARFNAPLRQQALSVAEEERTLSADRARIAAALAEAAAERQCVVDACGREVDERVAAEVSRRRAELEQQRSAWRVERDGLVAKWSQGREELANPEDRPAEPTPAAHEAAHTLWRERTKAEAPAANAPPSPHDVAADFLQRMPALAPVVVGTTLALARNADFAAAAKSPFDLVVLDDADRLAEPEFFAILAKAPRALAIGSVGAAVSSFTKLWRLLHPAEIPMAYQWSRLNDGFLCTLRPLTAADEPYVESERLADFPEIELRILSDPRMPPRLAQVVFPASLSATQAKRFIYRELQEAAVDRVDRPKQFHDTPERFTIAWECPESPTEEAVDLEPGLREAICVKDGQLTTCHIEFDKSAGWDQAKIHDWLRRHIPTLDAPRTALL